MLFSYTNRLFSYYQLPQSIIFFKSLSQQKMIKNAAQAGFILSCRRSPVTHQERSTAVPAVTETGARRLFHIQF